eukprot:m.36018 g.36018  ORF g.36018 m.36018 type:complete len:447 (-) comp9002_c0_seq2:52-1392(-)
MSSRDFSTRNWKRPLHRKQALWQEPVCHRCQQHCGWIEVSCMHGWVCCSNCIASETKCLYSYEYRYVQPKEMHYERQCIKLTTTITKTYTDTSTISTTFSTITTFTATVKSTPTTSTSSTSTTSSTIELLKQTVASTRSATHTSTYSVREKRMTPSTTMVLSSTTVTKSLKLSIDQVVETSTASTTLPNVTSLSSTPGISTHSNTTSSPESVPSNAAAMANNGNDELLTGFTLWLVVAAGSFVVLLLVGFALWKRNRVNKLKALKANRRPPDIITRTLRMESGTSNTDEPFHYENPLCTKPKRPRSGTMWTKNANLSGPLRDLALGHHEGHEPILTAISTSRKLPLGGRRSLSASSCDSGGSVHSLFHLYEQPVTLNEDAYEVISTNKSNGTQQEDYYLVPREGYRDSVQYECIENDYANITPSRIYQHASKTENLKDRHIDGTIV